LKNLFKTWAQAIFSDCEKPWFMVTSTLLHGFKIGEKSGIIDPEFGVYGAIQNLTLAVLFAHFKFE